MDRMPELFAGPVGYSDHTQDMTLVLAAVRAGNIVEKHITYRFQHPDAQDWKDPVGPDDFAEFVQKIRDVEAALGRPVRKSRL